MIKFIGSPNVSMDIPKCGVSTFATINHKNHGEENVFAFSSQTIAEGAKKQIVWVRGHVYINLWKRHYPKSTIFTFLRDPVERTISMWFYSYRGTSGRERRIPIIEWIADPTIEYYRENRINTMTAFLSGSNTSFVSDLDEAKKNLAEINFGITEKFEESMQRFQAKFPELFPDISFKIQNKTEHDVEVSKADREVIKETNNLDVQLYDYALKLFKKGD